MPVHKTILKPELLVHTRIPAFRYQRREDQELKAPSSCIVSAWPDHTRRYKSHVTFVSVSYARVCRMPASPASLKTTLLSLIRKELSWRTAVRLFYSKPWLALKRPPAHSKLDIFYFNCFMGSSFSDYVHNFFTWTYFKPCNKWNLISFWPSKTMFRNYMSRR